MKRFLCTVLLSILFSSSVFAQVALELKVGEEVDIIKNIEDAKGAGCIATLKSEVPKIKVRDCEAILRFSHRYKGQVFPGEQFAKVCVTSGERKGVCGWVLITRQNM